MRVLGIDPGTMVTGYGVVDDINGKLSHVTHGTIEGKRKDSFPDRLKLIFDGLNKVVSTGGAITNLGFFELMYLS